MIPRLLGRMTGVLREDRGYATVVSVGIIIALVSLAGVVAVATTLVVATHRAQMAADLAAVAGAGARAYGHPACTAAGETAVLNQAQLVDCAVSGPDVTVTVSVTGRSAEAKAGPL